MGIPKILNKITSHQEDINIAFIWLYSIFGACLIFYAPILFENPNTYFYVFSTISQSFVALVAFLGAIVVFKMQLIENEMKDIIKSLGRALRHHSSQNADYFSVDRVIDLISARVEGDMYYSALVLGGSELRKLRDEKRKIRRSMVDFTIWNFFVVATALILLPISLFFVSGCLLYVGALFVLFNISISIKALHYGYFLVRLTMGYDFEFSV